ncbi:MAG: hypothetical protein ABSF45_29880 [Terriglobia bacterium]
MIIDRNLVEVAGLAVLALARPSSLYGLDRLLFKRGAADEKSPDERVSLNRRDVFKNLAGVPVLGAFAATMAAVYSGSQAQQDTFRAGATPGFGASARSVRPGNIVSIRDYERLAPTKMSTTSYELVASGVGDCQTVYWNEAAFQRIVLRKKRASTS